MPEIVKTQVMTMIQKHFFKEYTEESEEREEFNQAIEVWSARPISELQERLD